MTSPRRSTRIQENCSYVPALDENSDEMSNFSEDLRQSEDPDAKILYTPHKPRPKRQKVEHTGTEIAREGQMVKPQRPDKYVRGRRGHLKLMTEMPLDTLFEIFRLLDPLDLLHLSWASKSLHAIVMGKSSIYLWEEAYARLYESENPPPRCPEDVNLAQYTHFLYNQKCMVCNTRKGSYTSWMMRLRACKHCLDSDLFTSAYHASGIHVLEITAKKRHYCWTSEIEKAKEKDDYEERRKLVNKRKEGTSEFNLWKIRCSKDRSDDLSQRRAQRSIAIFKKLEEIGWTESNIREINDGQLPDDLPGFGTVKKLTNRDWESIRPNIESILSEWKEEHLNILRNRHLHNRWDQFEKSFKEWNDAQTLDRTYGPRAVDILVMEPFFTSVFMSVTEGAEFAVADIDHAAKEWIEWRNDFVFSVLPQDLQDRYLASKSSLPLLAIFRFSMPSKLTLDEVCGFREIIQRNVPPQYSNERKIYNAITRSLASRPGNYYLGPWKWQSSDLRFHAKLYQITKDTLEYLEMDPYTTTLAQVREYKQKFTCLGCKYPRPHSFEDMIVHDLDMGFRYCYEEKERPPLSLRWVRVEDENVSSRA